MKKLLTQIAQLEKISAELEPDESKREQYNALVNSYTDDFINSLPNRPAYSKGDADATKLSVNKTTQSLPN